MNRVYCFITRHYHWLLEPYVHFHDKYWGYPMTIVTDVPLTFETHHTVLEMPEYCNHFYHDRMGQMVKEVINQYDEPLVTISLPDFWVCEKVDTKKMKKLEKYILENGKIARTHLWKGMGEKGRSEDVIKEVAGMVVNRVSPYDKHIGQLGATSGLLAIWSKKFLNHYYRDEWTWADLELSTEIFAKEEYETGNWYSVITDPALVDINHVCLTRKKELAKIESLKDDEKEYARQFIPEGYEICE